MPFRRISYFWGFLSWRECEDYKFIRSPGNRIIINLSTGGQYSLSHSRTHTVCFLWSFRFPLASKPLKTLPTWHPSPQRIVSQSNKSRNKLEVRRARWRCPRDVTSKLSDPCLHHTWKKRMTFIALLIEEVVNESSPCSTRGASEQSVLPSCFVFFPPLD